MRKWTGKSVSTHYEPKRLAFLCCVPNPHFSVESLISRYEVHFDKSRQLGEEKPRNCCSPAAGCSASPAMPLAAMEPAPESCPQPQPGSRSGSRGVRLLLLPLARRVMQPRAEAGLRRLKALLEGAAP